MEHDNVQKRKRIRTTKEAHRSPSYIYRVCVCDARLRRCIYVYIYNRCSETYNP